MPIFKLLRKTTFLAATILACHNFGFAQTGDPQIGNDALRFRFLGPQVGNRISAVAGVPGDPSTYYAGAASGGIWKSTDGGNRFTAIFDDQPVTAIGALAVAPSDPSTVWAGTGEAWAIRDSDVTGNGVYKSVDAGKHWKHAGLSETGRIGRIVVNPANASNVFVCALGRTTGPQQERGVFRTNDGGEHWDRVLFADENTGCSGLTMDPHNARVLLAGMWQVEMHTYGEFSGGPGSGVFISRDGGTTWARINGRGLPKPPVGKIDVAIAPTDSNRMYALIQTAGQGSLWRSDDAGDSWCVVSHSRALIGRAGYYIRLAVSPANENEVTVANSSVHLSLDGGETFKVVPWGGDTHDIWIDPTNADRFVITDDAGMSITTVHGRGSHRVQLPIGQMYHVAVDNRIPYWVYTNMQDSSTMRGPSPPRGAGPYGSDEPSEDENADAGSSAGQAGNKAASAPAVVNPTKSTTAPAPTEPGAQSQEPADAAAARRNRPPTAGGFSYGQSDNWEYRLGGCESGFTYPDPTDTNIVWASCYGDEVTRYDARTKEARSVSPWLHTIDSPPNDTKYRCHWTSPIAIDPFDHNTVYYGCQVIFKTSNSGQSWKVISPDLSTQDPSRIVSSGGIVGDNLGQFYGEVVFAIAPSSLQKGLIWAGTNDGKIWITHDGGGQWTDLTKNVTGLPAWGTVSKIEPSPFDPGTAYVAVDCHLMDNRDPFIFKTSDFGATWKQISGNLPKGPLAYVKSVTEDPNRKGLLFAGTGNAFYFSLNDGGRWSPLDAGLPHAPVTWIAVQKNFHDVVVSTYGRGIYVLDDITPLEQMTGAGGNDNSVVLYKPRPAYRLAEGGNAFFDFSLPTASPAQITVLDQAGKVVREFKSASAHAGLNRKAWDLRYDPPQLVKLRTRAPDNPYIWDEPRFRHAESRPITHWGLQPAEVGPMATPGEYTVRLTVAGKSYTEPIQILRTPETAGSDQDLDASVKLQLRIRSDVNSASEMVNRLEWMRKQLEDVSRMLRSDPAKANELKAEASLEAKMEAVEFKLITRAEANSDDKYFSQAYKIYLNLLWLNGEVGPGGGDVAGGVNYRPTDTDVQLLEMLEKQLAGVREEYRTLMEKDVPAFDRSMASSGTMPLQ